MTGTGDRKRVLIVDDDAAIRMTVRFILEDNGYEVQEANDGFEGLEVLKNGYDPDLIFLDLMMPRMDGWEFTQTYLQNAKSQGFSPAPIIVISAFRERPTPDGVAAALPKPFTMDAMLKAAQEHARSQNVPKARAAR